MQTHNKETLANWLARQTTLSATYWRTNTRNNLETITKEAATLVTIPDSTSLVDRRSAYHLIDFIVSSCSGGSLWFVRRKKRI